MSENVGIIVMTHGDFGKAAMESAQLIVGQQDNYDTVSVFVVDDVEQLKQELFDKVNQLDTSNGLILFTDIVGGTPTNLASELLTREDALVVAGVNLPILLEVFTNCTKDIQSLKEIITSTYNQGLSVRTNEDIEGEDDDEYSL
ncbi:PTS sugar transporter subunit IIA [Tetragenococcus halophilus]|uniref:Phosphotransferase system enzyme IIA component n=1 Tax=Tetragenococcus halophilus (strain DSM 20338 / JCM 20259 / NCIMB 9735 / NBRC 12172) TaxID=945021 RepID=A0AAN1SHC3_TETHN|nr:PTS sugar transporter subunit IIA [Tetragenococcus halophilus]MDN6140742.1 PTS sugar transporter subunit IIA [Tetragenococcus koreensis]MDN6730469.1 PTS sugar transporter subunit IIA [Alkalibacterium sp.]MCO8286314.1 PTS sugar transporter subunit IIA [Tetragenococcus halophilus]MDN6580903.1 PTS sugar transporter subunit IIA [Tetragenococcus koreensis]NWN99385.1 PTS sugar transporter subunit IIA [Tetragenococcus halophilus]